MTNSSKRHPLPPVTLGARFGKRTVLALAPRRYGNRVFVRCRCDCGDESEVRYADLCRGKRLACNGCKSVPLKHGSARHPSQSPEYRAWCAIKGRCTNPKLSGWHNYGGRGITVAPRWLASFEAFLADVGPKPSAGHSIERIDTNGNYEPGNVKWATRAQQNNNRRQHYWLEHQGERLNLGQWAQRVRIDRTTLYCRLQRGWSAAETLLTRPGEARRATTAEEPIPDRHP